MEEGKDSDTVRSLISNDKTIIYPETYLLKEPLSPHFAAKLDGVEIDLNNIILPVRAESNRHLIIEGAGGLMVPINHMHYVIDIAKKTNCELIVVITNYLGCINHSLLTIDYLIRNQFKIKALVFNGEFEEDVKNAITGYISDTAIIGIPTIENLTKSQVKVISSEIMQQIAF